MKDKKIIYILLIIVILIIGIIVVINVRNNTKNQDNNTQTGIQYNEETGEYYILDETTNEIKASSTDESGLQIYIDNPDYNPNPLIDSSEEGQEKNAEEYKGVYDEVTGKYVNELTGKEIK